ncbi:hypothetical protein [Zunongwangia profunda]|uniref:hypothetical protein n=1 Tax=Zunongwangia profunda TaxID=398743 RepID=UPI0023A7F654|nr:hypothetical protein [Zunongwangia profunda]
MAITPFLFYLYEYAPQNTDVWKTRFFTLSAGGFSSVQGFTHALFTKVTFLIITTLWFFTSNRWWRYAILIPFTMFLFQLTGVLNYNVQYVDEYDFWKALPLILPILVFMICISFKMNTKINQLDLGEELNRDIDKFLEEDEY